MSSLAASRIARSQAGTRRWSVGGIVSQVLVSLAALLCAFPFIWMIASALKPEDQVFQTPPMLIGRALEWQNFAAAWSYVPFGTFMVNGVVVAGLGTIITVASSALAAYAFARLHWAGRDSIFLLYLGTLMVPQEVVVVPMFILMHELGWVNSYQALILPWAFTAFGTFMMRQFFLTIPIELESAAIIDGANKVRILWSVILPLARPAMAILAVFTFINYWNSFLWPLIVVNTQDKATVPLGLQMFLSQQGDQWNYLMAGSTISMLPTALIVILLQRHLVKGIALSGFGGQ
ncbi:MAG: carbohydrate ABC transporter permease [Candidatus Dormiibacterota bacterium]